MPFTRGTEAVQTPVPLARPNVAPSAFDQVTVETATSSVEVPEIESGDEFVTAVAPLVGEVITTVGGFESCRTVIVSIEVFPELSVAVIVIRLSPAASAIAGVLQEAVPV